MTTKKLDTCKKYLFVGNVIRLLMFFYCNLVNMLSNYPVRLKVALSTAVIYTQTC